MMNKRIPFAILVLLALTAACTFDPVSLERDRAEQARAEAQEARAEAERQRVIAVAAKAEAMREAARAKATQEFLQAMLASSNPDREGKEVTVLEVMDNASKKIGTAFQDQPETRASLHYTMATTYMKLGLYDEAEKHFKAALEDRKGLFGEEHPSTQEALEGLITLYKAWGKNAEAEAYKKLKKELQ
jgi:tetratricopeptide (TPR) repeat protein